MTHEDLRALSPLIYNHITPYGRFEMDLDKDWCYDSSSFSESPSLWRALLCFPTNGPKSSDATFTPN